MTESKDFAAEYAGRGAYHHRLAGFEKLWIERNYALLSEGAGSKILDIACGDGRLADFLPAETILDGFDLVPDAVRLAAAKGRYRKVWEGDIKDVSNYNGAPYDLYVCSLSLQYLTHEELWGHLRHMAGLLKKGGVYRFSYPNTKPEYAPGPLRQRLGEIFETVRLKPVCGFIQDAQTLTAGDLQEAFERSLSAPVEESYHYVAEASQS